MVRCIRSINTSFQWSFAASNTAYFYSLHCCLSDVSGIWRMTQDLRIFDNIEIWFLCSCLSVYIICKLTNFSFRSSLQGIIISPASFL